MDVAVLCILGIICFLMGLFAIFETTTNMRYFCRVEDVFIFLILGLVGVLVGLLGICLILTSFGVIV